MSEEQELLLVDDLLALRRIQSGDVPDLFEIYSNPDVTRFEFFEPWTLEQVESLVCSQTQTIPGESGVPLDLVAVLRSENKVLGNCQITVRNVDEQLGEIGFSFNPMFTGRGFATKSINAALGYGFTRLGLRQIVATADIRNERSWRLMERLGMRREAEFNHDILIDGKSVADYIYTISSCEWKALNGVL